MSTSQYQGGRGAAGIKPCVLIPTYDDETSKEKADEKNRSELLTFLNEAT